MQRAAAGAAAAVARAATPAAALRLPPPPAHPARRGRLHPAGAGRGAGPRRAQLRRCATTQEAAAEPEGGAPDGPFDDPAPAPPAVAASEIPRVLLVTGDPFAEESFAKVATDPPWLRERLLRRWESFLWEHSLSRHDDLSSWRPLSVAVHALTADYNLKVLGWSRHPLDTSRIVYTLLNDSMVRTMPTTVVPHYHIDQVRKLWAAGNEPFYFRDAAGHSANFTYCERFAKQPAVHVDSEYARFGEGYAPAKPQPAPHLPEVFVLVAGLDSGWDDMRSNPPGVIGPDIRECRRHYANQVNDKSSAVHGAGPAVFLLNHLFNRYGCKLQNQVVTNNDLKRISFFIEHPGAHAQKPRVPREGRAGSHQHALPSAHEGRFSGMPTKPLGAA